MALRGTPASTVPAQNTHPHHCFPEYQHLPLPPPLKDDVTLIRCQIPLAWEDVELLPIPIQKNNPSLSDPTSSGKVGHHLLPFSYIIYLYKHFNASSMQKAFFF